MLYFIGEILADIIINENGDAKVNLGGAPFNAAVAAKENGAQVTFIGRVGKDVIGNELEKQAAKYQLDKCALQIDENRNTTLAFVNLSNGERSF